MATRIPQALIDEAMKWSVLDYFNKFEPSVLTQSGSEYRRRDHPSCCISGDGWLFDWKSRGLSGRGAVSYLRKCEGISFPDAIKLLTGEDIDRVRQEYTHKEINKVEMPFVLPEANYTNRQLIDYLYGRGISKKVINYCIQQGSAYQSKEYAGAVLIGYDDSREPLYITREVYKKLLDTPDVGNVIADCKQHTLILPQEALAGMKRVTNAVFVGYDSDHNAAYAMKRGFYDRVVIEDGKEVKRSYRGEVTSSSKSYPFSMLDKSGKSNSVHIFEAAIDAMSYATLIDLYSSDFRRMNLMSLGGAQSGKDNKFAPDEVTLPLALEQLIKSGNGNISKVYIHFDNDSAGVTHAKALSEKLSKLGIASEIKLPPSGKDFNDFLKNTLAKLEQNRSLTPREVLAQR